MATCPRCHNALSEGHYCRPIWVRRLWRQIGYTLVGGAVGAFVQELSSAPPVPVLGFVLGGMFFFGLHEALKTD